MTRDELVKQFNNLRSAAELKLGDAAKAISNDKFEDATKLQGEADELSAKANAIKSQIEKSDQVEGLSVANPAKSEPVRMPFDTTENTPSNTQAQPEGDSFAKTAYVLKYGNDMGEAVKTVTKDMYGNDYYEKRSNQNRAFSKYLRYGFERMTANEYESLRNLIYTPDMIESEVKSGYTVREILSNKTDQEAASVELGGALVPVEYQNEIIKRMMGMTIVRGRARQITTARDSVEWPRLEGGNSQYTSAVRVTWVDETPTSATIAQTNATFSTQKVPVNTVMARTDLSRNLLEDAAAPIMSIVAQLFAEAQAVDEDAKFLTGIGGNAPQGVLGARATGEDPSPVTGVSVANSGNASALTADGLIDLVYTLDAQYLRGAVLVGRKAAFKDIRKLKDGVGDYLWQKGIERGAPPSVLGYDFFMNESMPAVGANTHPLIFGDFGLGYIIIDRVGMTIERVTDATTTGQNKVALFARRRLGGQVVAPWAFVAQKVSA